MQQYPFHHQWKKERMEELFVAILSMLLLAALIPLYLWKRRQAPRSPDHAEEDVQVPQREAVVRATGNRRMRRRPASAASTSSAPIEEGCATIFRPLRISSDLLMTKMRTAVIQGLLKFYDLNRKFKCGIEMIYHTLYSPSSSHSLYPISTSTLEIEWRSYFIAGFVGQLNTGIYWTKRFSYKMRTAEIVDGSDDEAAEGDYYNSKASKKKDKKRQEREAQRQVQSYILPVIS
ncbi:hypothetical protein RHGRI_009516 [Rhododendron griersonianum]|uniref:Uncharacterized protein n=1 Tax=Rhododendron griersonianum TaxID=479676 RepID=A0AAV6KFR9_9ERIC|nr:hypothetical protein RHGRI_009516 [Rhododendron griersonianum]